VSGSGISWAICKSAPRSRQITTPAPHHSVTCNLCRRTLLSRPSGRCLMWVVRWSSVHWFINATLSSPHCCWTPGTRSCSQRKTTRSVLRHYDDDVGFVLCLKVQSQYTEALGYTCCVYFFTLHYINTYYTPVTILTIQYLLQNNVQHRARWDWLGLYKSND